MPTERFGNTYNRSVPLAATITATSPTMRVTKATADDYGFPTQPQFRLLLNREIVLVTGVTVVSTSYEYTITRAVEADAEGNGAAATHTAGTRVWHILTAGALEALGDDAGSTALTDPTTSASLRVRRPAERLYLATTYR